jgi:cyclophilin family peptidyl-prolyl cis-trans isomerase
MVTIKTSKGDIKVQLHEDKAPVSAENFLQYAKDGHYEGTIFHRVIPGFMVQGGGMDANMDERDTRPPIKNESTNGLENKKYTLAMARTNVPDSATSQFFINTSDNGFLNQSESSDGVGYAVFGEVTEGQDVVDAISGVATTTKGPHADVPSEPIEILSIEVE